MVIALMNAQSIRPHYQWETRFSHVADSVVERRIDGKTRIVDEDFLRVVRIAADVRDSDIFRPLTEVVDV